MFRKAITIDELPISQQDCPNLWTWTSDIPINSYSNGTDYPKISIITPSFNQGEFIEQTIRSVILQNYPNLQYIVIDGGSTDGTVEILEKYSEWIDYWVSETDRGQSHAINKGLKICDGEWFNWINSDDYLMPDAIANMVNAVGKFPNAKIVTGVTENIREGNVFGQYSATFSQDSNFPFFNVGVNQPGSLLRLAEVKACNGVREDLGLCMDLDLWLQILIKNDQNSLISIPEIVSTYRYHSQSKTCSTQDAFALEEFAILLDIYQSLLSIPVPESLEQLRTQCKASKFNYVSNNTYKSDQLSKQFFDRLLVNDSLLFRAIMQSPKLKEGFFHYFQELLEELNSEIHQLYGQNTEKIISNAWLRAMQNKGSLYKTGILMTLKTLPFIHTIKELARITVKGKR